MRWNNKRQINKMLQVDMQDKKESKLSGIIDKINIFKLFYKPEEFLRELYDRNTISYLFLIVNLINITISLLLGFDFVIIKGLLISLVLYNIIILVLNITTQAELKPTEWANIFLHGYLYYTLGILVLICTIRFSYIPTIIFSIFSAISFFTIVRTTFYFCSYKDKLLLYICLFLGFLFLFFNSALGVKMLYKENGVTDEDIFKLNRGFYYIQPSQDLEEDFNSIFNPNEQYGEVDENGNLIHRLPSVSEAIIE